MITRFRFALCFIILNSSFILSALAQGTAFTYQGRLSDNGGPVNGSYDFSFQLFDAASSGASQGSLLSKVGVPVSDGLFTVTLDFGASPFSAGDPRWLEIKVRTNNAGTYGLIDPRLPLTATPYAVTAGNVVSGGLAAGTYSNALTLNNAANSVSGAFTGNGANVTNVNAATLNGLTGGSFWNTNGNSGANPTNGAFLGTTDNLPLEIKVNGQRAFRIEPKTGSSDSSPNLIAGHPGNVVSNGVYGATIIGGGSSDFPNRVNRVGGKFATVLGGVANQAIGPFSMAMGFGSFARGELSFALGDNCEANGASSTALGDNTIAGGDDSTAMGTGTTASGQASTATGYFTTASGNQSTAMGYGTTASGFSSVAMGRGTVASGAFSTAMGHYAQATNQGTFVWADSTSSTPFTSTSSDQFLLRASGGVGIGTASPTLQLTVGGAGNYVSKAAAAIMLDNTSANGRRWEWHALDDGRMQFVDFNAAASRLMIDTNGNIGMGTGNPASALDVESPDGVSVALRLVSGASWPLIINQSPVSLFSITNGGQARLAITPGGFVGIGTTSPEAPFHVTEGSAGSVTASANAIAVFERAGAGYVSVLTPAASDSGILFGNPNNPADGGVLFNANAPRGLEFRAGGNSVKMVIAADGNVGIGNTNPTNKLMVVNARCDGSSWINASDRNLKQGFAVVNPQEILAKVAALPIQSWSYKAQPEQKHVGPVAQDFRAAFALGQDDTSIATVDADGVALAAIQGLNQKLEETRYENAELKARLERLEKLLEDSTHR